MTRRRGRRCKSCGEHWPDPHNPYCPLRDSEAHERKRRPKSEEGNGK